MRKLLIIALTFAISIPNMAFAQNDEESAQERAVSTLLNGEVFTYVATQVTSSAGGALTTNQNKFHLLKDSIVVNLPYSGTAHGASLGTEGNPLQFVTTDFQVSQKMLRKGDRMITIQMSSPNGHRIRANLRVNKLGAGTMTFNVSRMSAMSFAGQVTNLLYKEDGETK